MDSRKFGDKITKLQQKYKKYSKRRFRGSLKPYKEENNRKIRIIEKKREEMGTNGKKREETGIKGEKRQEETGNNGKKRKETGRNQRVTERSVKIYCYYIMLTLVSLVNVLFIYIYVTKRSPKGHQQFTERSLKGH